MPRRPTIADTFFRVLRDTDQLALLDRKELDSILRLARRTGVLARLAIRIEGSNARDRLPAKALDLLAASRPVAQHHERSVRFEVNRVQRALVPTGQKVILLKGAAYIMAGLPAGSGRLVSDVDILVPKQHLSTVEQALTAAGWRAMKLDPYDQRYYRKWMHELPPLRHETRQTVIDVHHAILPETARLRPDTAKLFDSAVPLGRDMATLGNEDMVLHSAAHLFADGDLAGGIRDLLDLDSLLRHFGSNDPDFWRRLVPRAAEHQLSRPLFYALRYCTRLLQTPVPAEVLRASAPATPPSAVLATMDRLCTLALAARGDHRWTTGLAMWALYVRSHWLRMPPLLLVRHLATKALRRRKELPA